MKVLIVSTIVVVIVLFGWLSLTVVGDVVGNSHSFSSDIRSR